MRIRGEDGIKSHRQNKGIQDRKGQNRRGGPVVRVRNPACLFLLVACSSIISVGMLAWSMETVTSTENDRRLNKDTWLQDGEDLRKRVEKDVPTTTATTTTTTTTTSNRSIMMNGTTTGQQAILNDESSAVQQALAFVKSRQKDYFRAGIEHEWKMRGLGYLYTYHKIVLSAFLARKDDDDQNGGKQPTFQHPGRHRIIIQNVHPDQQKTHDNNNNNNNYCALLTVWVRVNGPEIFAGTAHAKMIRPTKSQRHYFHTTKTDCHWEFAFHVQVPGEYHMDARVLLWNANAPVTFYPPLEDYKSHTAHDQQILERTACPHTSQTTYQQQPSILQDEENSLTYSLHDSQIQQRNEIHRKPFQTTSRTATTTTTRGGGKALQGGLIGFKFYNPIQSCCEICRRTKHCQYWETPPASLEQTTHPAQTGCELYFDPNLINDDNNNTSHWFRKAEPIYPISARLSMAIRQELLYQQQQQKQRNLLEQDNNDEQNLRKQVKQAFGYSHEFDPLINNNQSKPNHSLENAAYFLGCGWSFQFTMNFPCLSGELDDRVHFLDPSSFVLLPPEEEEEQAPPAQESPVVVSPKDKRPKPLCEVEDERFATAAAAGRWVRLSEDEKNTECPFLRTVDPKYNQHFDITDNLNGSHPYCWHRDDLTTVGNKCGELNCATIPQQSIWKSSLSREKDWMGIWRPYECEYKEYTDTELQECINDRKIVQIEVIGASIAGFLRQYIDQRLQNIQMYPSREEEEHDSTTKTTRVTISTVQWPHLLWHYATPEEWVETLQNTENHSRRRPSIPSKRVERYWVSPFYTVSEREPYVHLGRVQQFQQTAMDYLVRRKGYKLINAFDMSAAFAYDTATQNDGLHIIGPPMKMIVIKAFHHICSRLS